MFNKSNNLTNILILTMISATTYSISSTSWINIWMALEINSLAFIPLMMSLTHLKSIESMITYFLVQALSSTNLILFIVMNNLNNPWLSPILNKNLLITLILLMKMGAAPFHIWFPKTLKEIHWMPGFLLMTWQKIIPLVIIKYYMMKLIITMSVIFSVLIASISGLNQTDMKLIMAFSSISHLGWLLSIMILNLNMLILYFLMYSMLNFIMCQMFFLMKIKTLTNIHLLNYFNHPKMMLLLNFFSMGGFPPFLGFFPKWMVIMALISNNMYLTMMILIFCAMINMFFYMRVMVSSVILATTQLKWSIYYKWNNIAMTKMMVFNYISFMILLITMIKNF